MNLLSQMAEDIINKKIKTCTICNSKINKLNIACLILAKNISYNESSCLYYGFIFCDKDLNSSPWNVHINSPTTISINYSDFNKEEILIKLKKANLLL